MPLKVLPATEADAPRAFEIEHLAYTTINDPINALLFPGPLPSDANEKRAESILKVKAEDPSTVWLKVVDSDSDDEMIAFAEWHVYPPGVEIPKPPKREFGPGSNPQVCEEFFGTLERRRGEVMGERPHVFLKFLHTDPKHQKRGAGGMLVKWGVDKAKEMGLPAYLEASTAGKPLYEKHGFETIGECIFDLGKWGGEGTSGVALMLHPGGQR